jgi:hypothetical protein
MDGIQHNTIKRNAIAVFGISTIDTNATIKGDEIKAYKKIGGWTMLNVRTGKYFQCNSDILRRFTIITEQITA